MPLTTKSLTPVSWTLVVVTDGRDDYLAQTLEAARQHLPEPTARVMVDDTGDQAHSAYLNALYGDRFEVAGRDGRRGLAATVAYAWSLCGTDYIFHLEDDFLLTEPVDIDAMASVLDANPRLAQMCLLRQPWNAEEQAAGGIVEKDPGDYTDRDGWLEHSRLFSLNPCLIPNEIYAAGWHEGNERGFTDMLVEEGWRFGYWGRRGDPPRCLHIGVRRAAGWAL